MRLQNQSKSLPLLDALSITTKKDRLEHCTFLGKFSMHMTEYYALQLLRYASLSKISRQTPYKRDAVHEIRATKQRRIHGGMREVTGIPE